MNLLLIIKAIRVHEKFTQYRKKVKSKKISPFLLSLLCLILSKILFWCILLMEVGPHCTYFVLPFPSHTLFLNYILDIFFMLISSNLLHSTWYCLVWICQPLPDGHLHCFQFSTITNNAVVSILAYTPFPVCASSFPYRNNRRRAFLVAQWLRVRLPMRGTRVRALVWEDPTCRGAAGPVSHNY